MAKAAVRRSTRERSLTLGLNDVTTAAVSRDIFHDFVPLRGAVAPRDTIYLDALDQGKIPGFSAAAKDSLDFRHFEMNNFAYTCLCIFRGSA